MSENIEVEDLGYVKEIEGDVALVEMIKGGSCDSCAMHGFCGAGDKTVQHRIKTDLELSAGDTVRIFVSPQYRILSSFILFIFPILAMIGFYFIGQAIFVTEGLSILTSLVGLLFCGFIIYKIDRLFASRKIIFRIIERLDRASVS